MSDSDRQVLEVCLGRTRWRLRRNEALRRLALWGGISALLLLLLLVVRNLGAPAGWVTWAMPLGTLAAGVVHAARASVSPMEAAIFLDRRSAGGDLLATVLAAMGGPFEETNRLQARDRCRALDVAALARYRPSLIGKAVPVILALCLSVQMASGGDGPGPSSAGSPGAAGPGVGAEARALMTEIDHGSAPGARDLPERLREIFRKVEEARASRGETRKQLMSMPAVKAALQEGRVSIAEMDPSDLSSIGDALQDAVDRLPQGGGARLAAEAAQEALQTGSDEELAGALGALAEALGDDGGTALEEASSEIRRIASEQGIQLPAPEVRETAPSTEPYLELSAGGEALQRAMDREDVPRRYREAVRRYFERKGGGSR